MAVQTPVVPLVFALVHAWHAPEHAALQQTRSTQNPLEHWLPAVHAAALACFVAQALPVQYWVPRQSESPLHPHAVPEQLVPEQVCDPAAGQVVVEPVQ